MLELFSRLVQKQWLVRLANPLFGMFNPFLTSYRRSPYAAYRKLHEKAPRYHSRIFDSFVFSRHADCAQY